MVSRAGKGKKPIQKAEASLSQGEISTLRAVLIAHAPHEDIEAYDSAMIDRATAMALALVKKHKPGGSLIEIDLSGDVRRDDRGLAVITLVNDNMPFLFDSVMGEINETLSEPALVLHPVIYVRHAGGGVAEIYGDGGPSKGASQADRISLIQVHAPMMTADRAEALKKRLEAILAQVRTTVADWKPMLARLDETISAYRYSPVPVKQSLIDETIAFLEWLRDDNFTFIGMREYHYSGDSRTGKLERARKKGLGILADPDMRILRSGNQAVTTTPQVRAFLTGPEPLLVAKANVKSLVHRRVYLDYLGVKTFDARGKLDGELRIVGLFTSTAYTKSVLRIPFLRSKARAVIEKSGYSPSDHSGKALINVLESYPRDELFQIPVPLLRKHAETVMALEERPRVRALVRVDQFDRFVSVIVFVPRDRYNSQVRIRVGDWLKTAFDGRLSAYYPAFPEGSLARVHFIIGRSGGKTPKVDAADIEAAVRAIVRTWEDALAEAAERVDAGKDLVEIAARFPETYQTSFSPEEALVDARRIAAVSTENPIAMDFRRRHDHADDQATLMIYHHGAPVSLSKRVPMLENMGFHVISERTFEVADGGSGLVFVHDMEIASRAGRPIDAEMGRDRLDELFMSVWRGDSDNDGYNALVQTAELRDRQIAILRAFGRYLQQAGIPQNQDFIAAVLNRYPAIARALHDLFVARFDPEIGGARDKKVEAIRHSIAEAMDAVPNLEEDMVLRRILNLIEAAVRTNYFRPSEADRSCSLAIKFDPARIDGLPEPRPWREIFVYGAEVEGVHLRFGPVARGGLRWSDRAQDYRTEVLGLVKAQQVKNAVIVPVGAKGGFYPRRLPEGGSRDEIFNAGKAAYINFISSLLSITDNLEGDTVAPPPNLVRHEGDDPYFVVAADKGTATFSDTANAISQAHDFWLDDAFASGGSAGYDHKKMGITARGAWEAVKRHFREMNRDIQTEPFTVVGVGDMSGDVFGNGMLLSEKIRLVAAFDHRDIFIDPAPDEAVSFAERKRMFDLPRSSWQDYDQSKLSPGGGVFPRSQKSIKLSQEAADAIGLGKTVASPIEIMNAILKAPADLLWFGGIGTYVRASLESDAEVGDRANDAIRVTAGEVGAKVIGEGANLGITQRGRIEYGLAGGRCNSDAIDNSAGVNSSDVEVNIKIALTAAMREGLSRPQRNRLLADMTEDVARLVLANNYDQTLAISLDKRLGLSATDSHARLMTALERRDALNRAVEYLPSERQLAERRARGEPLTRAELGVLLAYAKIVMFDDVVASNVPDDPHLEAVLLGYFPDRMAKKYTAQIGSHRLRREIIATELGNDMINRCGPSFVADMQDMTGAAPAEVARAFVIARDGYDLDPLIDEIDALDNRIDGMAQIDLYLAVRHHIRAVSGWLLKNEPAGGGIAPEVERLRSLRKALEGRLSKLAPSFLREQLEERAHAAFKSGASEKLAERIALLPLTEHLPDIGLVGAMSDTEPLSAAKAFFAVTETFRIGRMEVAARAIQPTDYYEGLALSRAGDMIDRARRSLAVSALTGHGKSADPVAAWLEAGGERIAHAREKLSSLTDAADITVSRLTVAAGLMTDLTAM
ncbi:MAG: NAD-glutamate dehydrogenase [Rhizobiaceae bacterium]|nr:NAD-glutamate dehydrogenase [Rhizobiaceae bacterium]MCV0407268.1 NAD-glutamate dehydrogenase [Rhizobiaceae bacterium]